MLIPCALTLGFSFRAPLERIQTTDFLLSGFRKALRVLTGRPAIPAVARITLADPIGITLADPGAITLAGLASITPAGL